MSDDLITRLRRFSNTMYLTTHEAAEEIELLRKEIDYWQKRYWSLFERVSQEISEVAREF